MGPQRGVGRSPTRSAWLLLAFAAVLVGVVSLHLLWLLWKYVPVQAAVFEGMGLPLPVTTRISLAAAHWVIRLLPFVIVVSVPAASALVIVAVLLSLKPGAGERVLRAIVALGLGVAFTEMLACGFVVHSIHAAYAAALANPRVQESLAACEQVQQQRHASPNPTQ